MTDPDQAEASADSNVTAPSRQVMCTSCTQACITGTSAPDASTTVAVLA